MARGEDASISQQSPVFALQSKQRVGEHIRMHITNTTFHPSSDKTNKRQQHFGPGSNNTGIYIVSNLEVVLILI